MRAVDILRIEHRISYENLELVVGTERIPRQSSVIGMDTAADDVIHILAGRCSANDNVVEHNAATFVLGYLERQLGCCTVGDNIEGRLLPLRLTFELGVRQRTPHLNRAGTIINTQCVAVRSTGRLSVGKYQLRLEDTHQVDRRRDKTRDETHLLVGGVSRLNTVRTTHTAGRENETVAILHSPRIQILVSTLGHRQLYKLLCPTIRQTILKIYPQHFIRCSMHC